MNIGTKKAFNELIEVLFNYDSGDKIYHYTSIEAFYSIVTKNSLRLTNSMYMNDRDEFSVYLENFLEICKELQLEGKINKEIIEEVILTFEFNLNDHSLQNPYKHASYFIFSTSINNNQIPMWNNYSESTGICIEFDRLKLCELFNDCIGNLENTYLDNYKCIYNYKDKKELVLEVMNIFMLKFYRDKNEGIREFWNFMTKYGYMFKNEQFQYEDEYRYLLSLNSAYVDGINSELHNSEIAIDYYVTQNTIRPCIFINPEKKLPITKIFVSPLSKNETVLSGVTRFLISNGYDIEVEHKTFSYRKDY